nr:radical SAM protein [Dissulfurirhabdus thermomarina]
MGLACLAGALRARGHECRVFDLCVEPEAELDALAAAFAPELAAVSIRNVDNVAWPRTVRYLPRYRELCARLRAAARCPLVLGGAGFSLFPRQLMAALGADFGVVGSGEVPLAALAESLEAGGRGLEAVPNLLYRAGGRIRATGRRTLPLPETAPDRAGFRLDRYLAAGGMANVQTRRGCPFRCVYCGYPLIEGRRQRRRPVPEVVAELAGLAEQGIDEVFFVDSVFNHPVDYAKAICRGILAAGLRLRWTCYGAPRDLDAEAVDLFLRSGCMGIEFGTDTLSPRMLGAMGKAFTAAEAARVSALCRRAGLPFCHAILAGGPGEDRESLEETVDRLEALEPDAVVFMTGIRIIPGTRLHEIARAEGLLEPGADMLEARFYLPPGLAETLDELVPRLARRHKNWIFPGHAVRCSPELAARLRRQGVRGPLWLNLGR